MLSHVYMYSPSWYAYRTGRHVSLPYVQSSKYLGKLRLLFRSYVPIFPWANRYQDGEIASNGNERSTLRSPFFLPPPSSFYFSSLLFFHFLLLLLLLGNDLQHPPHGLQVLAGVDEHLEGAEPLDAVLAEVVEAEDRDVVRLERHAPALRRVRRQQVLLDGGQHVGRRHGPEDGDGRLVVGRGGVEGGGLDVGGVGGEGRRARGCGGRCAGGGRGRRGDGLSGEG